MTNKTEAQPEALRLAEFFESLTKSSHRWWDGVPVHEKAAAVLRALVTEIKQIKAERASQTNRAAAAEQQVTALTQRLDTANALNTEARNQLAQLSARQAVPDERLRKALEQIIEWNRTHAEHLCGDPDRAEGWACVREARSALSAAPHPPEREPLSQHDLERLVGNWFAEGWAKKAAFGMLDDYEMTRNRSHQ